MSASNTSTTSSNTSSFVSALVLGVVVASVYMVGFWLLHTKSPKVYEPRTYLAPEGRRPAILPKGFFGWFIAIIKEPDARVGEMNGVDAYFFVRFCRTMIFLLLPYWFLSWAVLMPVTATKPNNGQRGLNIFAFGNISQDKRWIAHIVVAVVLILWTLYVIHHEYKHLLAVRLAFLNSPAHASLARSRTVMVNNIPAAYMSESKIRELAAFVEGPVEQVWLARDVKKMEKIFDARADEVAQLEGGITKAQKLSAKNKLKGKLPAAGEAGGVEAGDPIARYVPAKKRPTHTIGLVSSLTLGFLGKKVQTLEYSPAFIREQTDALAVERAKLGEYPLANSAFVRFARQSDAHAFARGLSKSSGHRMIGAGTEVMPEDVVWSNLGMSPVMRKVRTVISWALTIMLIILWAPLVTFVGVISNIYTVCHKLSFLHWICTLPSVVVGIIQGILPPVLLAVLFMLLPIVLRIFIELQGEPRHSDIERKLWYRFWLFQIINGFLIVALASGITALLSNFDTLKNDVSEIPQSLAADLPQSSIFFLTFILTATLGGASKSLSRLIPYIMTKLAFIFRGATPRKVYKYDYGMSSIELATAWPPVALLGVIGIVYSIIQPITVGFAAVGLMLLYVTYKYMLIWVCDQPDSLETGGLYYPRALGAVFAALYVMEVTVGALFFFSKTTVGWVGGAIMAFMIVVTAFFEIWVEYTFRGQFLFLGAAKNYKADPSVEMLFHPTGEQMKDPAALAAAHVQQAAANPGPQYGNTTGLHLCAFDHPATWKDPPLVWIADDTLGIGRAEVARLGGEKVQASCLYARMDEKGRTEVDRGPPDEAWYGGKTEA